MPEEEEEQLSGYFQWMEYKSNLIIRYFRKERGVDGNTTTYELQIALLVAWPMMRSGFVALQLHLHLQVIGRSEEEKRSIDKSAISHVNKSRAMGTEIEEGSRSRRTRA
jgi:hypothetical protein